MADITDIKSIMYTEKSLALQEEGVIVVQTTPRMTKNALKEAFPFLWKVRKKKELVYLLFGPAVYFFILFI